MRATRGFTMTELILGMLIMSIVALAFAPLLTQTVASYSLAASRSRALHDARHAMFQITRELLLLDAGDLQGINGSQLQFVDENNVATEYSQTGTNVFRGQTMLVPNVNALTFNYFDDQGNITNVIASVRRISIVLRVDTPPQGIFTLRSEVFPRSFVYTNFQ
ncbi:MAG: prepilin-type N-terminal cleavage/methylation domain-containing protein [Deltaproteobacteria bacterium]|nr:prepilin-type N-terminal cleavage/methylation domain-containing protein [Deltaproteobacteria bacterium]